MTAHIGVLCMDSSHLRFHLTLAKELLARGVRVTFFNPDEQASEVVKEGAGFQGLGSLPLSPEQSAQRMTSGRFLLTYFGARAELVCDRAPAAIRKCGVDALLVDHMELAGGTVADMAGIPYVTTCNGLPMLRDPLVPPFYTLWSPGKARWRRWRNLLGYVLNDLLWKPVLGRINKYRRQAGLTPVRSIDDCYSPRGTILSMISEFDFPRSVSLSPLHYVGPFAGPASPEGRGADERLCSRKPLVYVSMGTLFGAHSDILGRIVESLDGLDVRVVFGLGGAQSDPFAGMSLPEGSIVMAVAPQQLVLPRCRLFITHGGVNSVLEGIRAGVPMVALPIAVDHFGTSRRIQCSGVGEFIPAAGINPPVLRETIRKVLQGSAHLRAVQSLQTAMQRYRGEFAAADVVERLLLARGRKWAQTRECLYTQTRHTQNLVGVPCEH